MKVLLFDIDTQFTVKELSNREAIPRVGDGYFVNDILYNVASVVWSDNLDEVTLSLRRV